MPVRVSPGGKSTLSDIWHLGQDILHEKLREEYNREAARIFNEGERIAAENGESGTMLAVLTRGKL